MEHTKYPAQKIRTLIRTIPDYPKAGVLFRDISTLICHPEGLQLVADSMTERYSEEKISKVAGIEARGFIFGSTLARELHVGFVPIRKKGKLPAETFSQEFDLEYGSDTLEIHVDAISDSDNVLLVDDLLATGGTAEAAIKLIEQCGGHVHECCFVANLPDLGGRKRLQESGHSVFSICEFAGE